MKTKLLTKTELKMLVFKKMRQEGKSYDQAFKEIAKELVYLNKEETKKKRCVKQKE